MADTCTVYILKSNMGELESWVTVDAESMYLLPSQQSNFLITINVPSNAGDHDYALFLQFKAKPKHSDYVHFDGNTQWIIVDNSAPQTPTFTVSPTSYTVFVNNWSSYDIRSASYTIYNHSSGINGIKSYTIALKKTDNTPVGSPLTKLAADNNYYTFSQLSANTGYKVSVTATDLAGNVTTKEIATSTPPAPPSSLTFSNITYISATLSWAASAGATGYNVYKKVNGQPSVLVNNSPVNGTSYTINNLEPNTSYTSFMKALSNVGPSDASTNVALKTIALPTINGVSQVCSSGTTVTLSSLISGYSVYWSTNSTNLILVSTNGSSAVFRANGNGNALIKASIQAPTGQILALSDKSVFTGLPSTPTNINGITSGQVFAENSQYTFSVLNNPIMVNQYIWQVSNVTLYSGQGTSAIDIVTPSMNPGNYDIMFTVKVKTANLCGSSGEYKVNAYVRAGFPYVKILSDTASENFQATFDTAIISDSASIISLFDNTSLQYLASVPRSSFVIYPNPASTELTISQNNDKTVQILGFNASQPKMIKSIKIVDSFGKIQTIRNFANDSYVITLNISNLKNGIYFLIINEESSPESYSFVKK